MKPAQPTPNNAGPKVALFVTCLINLIRPQVGVAAMKLLQEAGCEVVIPKTQTCCGQPNLNNGDDEAAKAVARHMIATFEPFDHVVGASGSCVATFKNDYPRILQDDKIWLHRAQALSEKSSELFSFLENKWLGAPPEVAAVAAYLDSCSGLRVLGIQKQPRALLSRVPSLTLVDMPEAEVCCGFGGTFCEKYSEISIAMADDKLAQLAAMRAQMLLGGDLGCLLHLAGRLAHLKLPLRVYHAAEILAGVGADKGMNPHAI